MSVIESNDQVPALPLQRLLDAVNEVARCESALAQAKSTLAILTVDLERPAA
jgi:hypothetical protein